MRKVEYRFVTVSHNIEYGGYGGQKEYEQLLKEGWQVVEERSEELISDEGNLYGWRWHYKLQK